MKAWIRGTWAVLRKEVRVELRSRYTVSALLIFVLSTLLIAVLAAGADDSNARVQAGILWIIILFSTSLGLGRAFVDEEVRGTILLLRLSASGSMVYCGKMLYSFLTVFTVNGVLVVVFVVLLNVVIIDLGLLLIALGVGTLGLVGATTFLSALIARSRRSGPLLPVLLFPLLLPHILASVEATLISLTGGPTGTWTAAANSLVAMTGFSGVTITASLLLFDYIWQE